jgi:hypothetical protein
LDESGIFSPADGSNCRIHICIAKVANPCAPSAPWNYGDNWNLFRVQAVSLDAASIYILS